MVKSWEQQLIFKWGKKKVQKIPAAFEGDMYVYNGKEIKCKEM